MASGSAEDDIAAFAAVAAVRSAFRYKLFPPEAHATASAVPGFDVYFGFINKFHG